MANILIKQGLEIAVPDFVITTDEARKVDLTSIIQTGTTASQAITAGTYFYLNDVLVRAKVDIANGATFTLNTNYEVVTAGALNELNEKFNYSTTEHVVGKWIDGSTLYGKTISCGALPNTSTKNISHNITGLEHVLHYEAMAIKTNAFKPMPYIWNNVNLIIAIEFSDQYIYINTTADYSSYTESYVTLFYTKTS